MRAQLLVYPALDAAMDSDSYREFADGALLRRGGHGALLGPLPRRRGPRATPTHRRCAPTTSPGVAPAYVAVAGHDLLRDDGLRYAEALRAAGVDVTLERYDDMVHGFLRWGGVVERARELVEALGEYTRAVIGRDRDAS